WISYSPASRCCLSASSIELRLAEAALPAARADAAEAIAATPVKAAIAMVAQSATVNACDPTRQVAASGRSVPAGVLRPRRHVRSREPGSPDDGGSRAPESGSGKASGHV